MKMIANKTVRMPFKPKSIQLVVINKILRGSHVFPMKNEGLSYPTHFLKIWGSDIRKNFHEKIIKQVNIFV